MLKKILKGMKNRSKGPYLLYPGCLLNASGKEIIENYRKVLESLGIQFIESDELRCCGGPALSAGFIDAFEKVKQGNIDVMKGMDTEGIITICPACNLIFNKEYGLKSFHISQLIAKKRDRISRTKREEISYHDPCRLGRDMGVYSAPRDVIKALGFELIEFEDNRENAACCGAGGNLNAYSPEISNAIAKKRLKGIKTKKLVTTCPLCYMHLKRNAKKDTEVIELSELLLGNIR